jgi:uncharacterized protein YukE
MRHSEQVNELGAALAKAQRKMEGAKKGSANPFFKSKYADLASVAGACLDHLNDAGIAVVQAPSTLDDGRVSVETMLIHMSGQWMAETLTGKPKDDGPQALGSVITYLRRYALAAFAGVAPEDDDAEAAEGRKGAKVEPKAVAPKGYQDWLADLEATADTGTAALQAAWKASAKELRDHLTTTNNAAWEAVKARAAKVVA